MIHVLKWNLAAGVEFLGEPPKWVMGIDEAGVSPFFGPMVYVAVVRFAEQQTSKYRDSKKIEARRRDEWVQRVLDEYEGVLAIPVAPKTIDQYRNAGLSFHEVKYHAALTLIQFVALQWGYDGVIYMDTISGYPDKDWDRIASALPIPIELHIAIQGEDQFNDVAAASIVASSFRFDFIDMLKDEVELKTGEVYDKLAQKWASENPASFQVRASWKNIKYPQATWWADWRAGGTIVIVTPDNERIELSTNETLNSRKGELEAIVTAMKKAKYGDVIKTDALFWVQKLMEKRIDFTGLNSQEAELFFEAKRLMILKGLRVEWVSREENKAS